MGAPVGDMFRHDGTDYHVQPLVMSRGCVEQLLRVYRLQCRRDLAELRQQKDELGEELYEETKQFLLESATCPGIQQAVKAMQTMEGLAAALHFCCDEIATLEDAKSLMAKMPNVLEIFKALATGLQEDLESSGNLSPLGTTRKAGKKSEA